MRQAVKSIEIESEFESISMVDHDNQMHDIGAII